MRMKKHIYILFFIFIFPACSAIAGSITLTTYYPAPTAAYNQVKLATNAPTPACSSAANVGTIYADSTGSLYVCMQNPNSPTIFQYYSYPQQCYNASCTFDASTGASTCAPTCASGFAQVPIDKAVPPDTFDQYQISTNTQIISIVCCSGTTSTCTPVNGVCSAWLPCAGGIQTCKTENPIASCGGTTAVGTTQSCTASCTPVNGTCSQWSANCTSTYQNCNDGTFTCMPGKSTPPSCGGQPAFQTCIAPCFWGHPGNPITDPYGTGAWICC